jgi:Na+/melibiose symporter-like transporter
MEKNKNNQIRWLGIRLTKKRAIYLTVLSGFASSFFAVAIFFAVPVLIYARTDIFPHDKLLYTYTLLLSISNFIASVICIGIFSYTLSKAKTFRKALKKQ